MKENLKKLYNETSLEIYENTFEEKEKCRLIEDMDNCLHELIGRTDSDGKEVIKELERIYGEFLALEKENAFVRGFSLATKLLSEAFT